MKLPPVFSLLAVGQEKLVLDAKQKLFISGKYLHFFIQFPMKLLSHESGFFGTQPVAQVSNVRLMEAVNSNKTFSTFHPSLSENCS